MSLFRRRSTIAVEAGRYRYGPEQRRQAKRHAAAADAEGYEVSLRRLRRGDSDFLHLMIYRSGDDLWKLPEWDARFSPPHLIDDGNDLSYGPEAE